SEISDPAGLFCPSISSRLALLPSAALPVRWNARLGNRPRRCSCLLLAYVHATSFFTSMARPADYLE
ncbi:MAG: hypothetical protein BJ554DRAFT_4450, partial [Olpidium bornovanus]